MQTPARHKTLPQVALVGSYDPELAAESCGTWGALAGFEHGPTMPNGSPKGSCRASRAQAYCRDLHDYTSLHRWPHFDNVVIGSDISNPLNAMLVSTQAHKLSDQVFRPTVADYETAVQGPILCSC